MKVQRKRMTAILLTLMMVFTMIPSMAFAGTSVERSVNAEDEPSAYDYEQTSAESVTVTVTLSNDGIPLQGNDANATPISHLEVIVPYFDLANYGLEEYYRYETDGDSGDYINENVVERPTVMHLYLYLLERYYMGLSHDEFLDWENKKNIMSYGGPESGVVNCFDGEAAYSTGEYSAITISGGATSTYLTAFFGHDCNLMYYRNHKYPLMMSNWGATSDYMLLSEGDDIDIAMYSNYDFYGSGAFLAFGKELYKEDDATEGQLTVKTYATTTAGVMSGADSPVEPCDGSLNPYVELYDSQWELVQEIGNGITDNGDGTYTLTLPETEGTYYLMASDASRGTSDSCCAPATAKVIVGDSANGGEEDETAKALEEAKTAAKAEIAAYKNASDYREDQQTELTEAIEAANTAIDAAETTDAVATAVSEAKTAMDAIKTAAELDQEEAQQDPCSEDHDYTDKIVKEEALKSEATCTEAAVYYKSCSQCSEVSTSDSDTFISGDAQGHKMGAYTTTKKAAVGAAGLQTATCSVCKTHKLTKTIPAAKTPTLSATTYTYDGKVKSPTVTIKDADGNAISSANYTITTPAGRTNAGTYTYKVTFKNNYEGTKSLTMTIKPAKLTTATLSATAYTFNNKVKTPAVTAKAGSLVAGSKRIKDSASIDLTYASGRKNVGTYKVTIKGKGNYTGTITKTFKINPKGVSISSLTKAKKAFTVKWKKPTATYRKQMTGYQIRYSTSSKMTNSKTVTVKSTTAVSKKVSKLSAKKTYYVQIRTYKTVNGTKYYSGWSKTKSVKTK